MWFENDYRRIFMDMHLNDTNDEYLSLLDIDNFVDCLSDADVSSVVVKAKSHVGLHYWPGKYGKMHRVLEKRNLDYVGEMIDKCHKKGINVIVYFSQVYDNYAYEKHPLWRLRSFAGTASRFPIPQKHNRYGLVCPNNPNYQKYCHDILTELCEKYNFEGVFLDMPFWPWPCYCKHCNEKFFKETGKMLPRIYNFDKKIWKEYIHARQHWIQEFIEHNTKAIKDVNPNISVEHNMAAIGLNWITGNVESHMLASDYAGGDYYGGYAEQSFMCKYYNNVTVNKPFSYITSRCDRNLFFHTVSRTTEDLLIHSINALVHNGAFSICDAMNPNGTITDELYHGAIKEVFAATKPLEKYVSGNIKSDVAVWYNTNYKTNKNYIESPMNIASILREKNIAFDVIGSKNIKNIKSKVLCIADVQEITDQELADIINYVENGGCLFITGSLGNNKDFEKFLGIKQNGISKYTYSYIEPKECFKDQMKTFDSKSPYPVEHTAIEADIIDSSVEVMATITYPYTTRSEDDFSAIHSDPPGIHTNLPAVTKVSRKNGTAMWVAMPLELTKAHHCRQSIADMICSLYDNKQMEFISNAPAFVEIIKWEKNGEIYLALINQQENTPIYPIDNITVQLKEKFAQFEILSDNNSGTEITIDNTLDNTTLNISKLGVFCVLHLKDEKANPLIQS